MIFKPFKYKLIYFTRQPKKFNIKKDIKLGVTRKRHAREI